MKMPRMMLKTLGCWGVVLLAIGHQTVIVAFFIVSSKARSEAVMAMIRFVF